MKVVIKYCLDLMDLQMGMETTLLSLEGTHNSIQDSTIKPGKSLANQTNTTMVKITTSLTITDKD